MPALIPQRIGVIGIAAGVTVTPAGKRMEPALRDAMNSQGQTTCAAGVGGQRVA